MFAGCDCPNCTEERRLITQAARDAVRELQDRPPWRCATCRWWDQSEHLKYDFYDTDYGYCPRISGKGEAYNLDPLIDLATRYDGDAWGLPPIDTHRDFGCVHWEPKEGETDEP